MRGYSQLRLGVPRGRRTPIRVGHGSVNPPSSEKWGAGGGVVVGRWNGEILRFLCKLVLESVLQNRFSFKHARADEFVDRGQSIRFGEGPAGGGKAVAPVTPPHPPPHPQVIL